MQSFAPHSDAWYLELSCPPSGVMLRNDASGGAGEGGGLGGEGGGGAGYPGDMVMSEMVVAPQDGETGSADALYGVHGGASSQSKPPPVELQYDSTGVRPLWTTSSRSRKYEAPAPSNVTERPSCSSLVRM